MDSAINVTDNDSLQGTEDATKHSVLNVLSRSHSASSLLPHYFPDDILIELPTERFGIDPNLAWNEHNSSSLPPNEMSYNLTYVGNHIYNNVPVNPHTESVATKVKMTEYPGQHESASINEDRRSDPTVSRKVGSKAEGIRGNYKCGKCGHPKLDPFGRPHNCQFVGSSLAPLLISVVTGASTNIICPHCKVGFTLVGRASTSADTAESEGSPRQNIHEPFLSTLGQTKPAKTSPPVETFIMTSYPYSRDCDILEPSAKKRKDLNDTFSEKAPSVQEDFVLEQSLESEAGSECEEADYFQFKKDTFAESATRGTSSRCNFKIPNPLQKLTSRNKLGILGRHEMTTDNEIQKEEIRNENDTLDPDCSVVSRILHDIDE